MAAPHPLSRLLGANPFFASLGGEVVEEVAALCMTRRLAAAETLFIKGDPGDALFAVRRGQIEIGAGTEGGRRVTFNLLGPGDVFGEIALLDGRARTADATAVEETELFVIRRRDFLELLTRRPALAIRLIEFLCERLRWVSTRVEEATLLPLDVRLARRLIALGEDYGAELVISQDQLAVFVGAARESVNRQLQAWKRRGLIELGRSRIRIRDAAGLSAAAAQA